MNETSRTNHDDIAHDRWLSFLDTFSRQHQDWLVTIEIFGPDGRRTEVEERHLKGISIDHAGDKERAYVQTGGTPEEHVTHVVNRSIRMNLKQLPSGAHQGLEITSADGTTTSISFRTAMLPEMLDGMAA